MALIVKFPSGARTPAPGSAPQGESAQILFFTGVRYERESDVGAEITALTAPAPSARRQKRVKIHKA